MESDEMSLLVAFPDGSESFVHGFEAGEIWAFLGTAKLLDRGFHAGLPVHTANLEVIRRMAQARGFRVESKPETAKGWTPVLLTYVGEGNARPTLKLVSETDRG